MMPSLLITARYSSSRLPGKLLLTIGKNTVLGHSFLRALSAGFNPILCTSTDSKDDALVSEAAKYDIPSFRGDLLNKLKRWDDCFKSLELVDGHILDADDPFFDPQEIRQSLDRLRLEQLDLVRTSERSDSGFATVGMSVTSQFMTALAIRSQELESSDFDVIPWSKLILSGDRVSQAEDKFLTLNRNKHIRLTLDYQEDFRLMDLIAQRFGFDCSRKTIENFLLENPEIMSINESRTRDFLVNKKVQLERNFHIES
jgi:spore coat polysaccharide biosynthesis protein SpsF